MRGDQWGKPDEPAKQAKGRQESDMAGSKKVLSQTSTENLSGGLAREFAYLIRAIRTLADPYRPELHYMRGPGPKWHAKHNPKRQTVDSHTRLASA